MATMEEAFGDYVATYPDVVAAVSTRTFAGLAPTEGDFPYITFDRIANTGEPHQLGQSILARARFQINCFANSKAANKITEDAVRNAIDGKERFIHMGVNFRRITIDDMRDLTDKSAPGGKINRWHTAIDCHVWYQRSIPTN